MNFLASPPLVVAYALAGTLNLDLTTEPLGTGSDGKPVYLKDIWPTPAEIQEFIAKSVDSAMFQQELRERVRRRRELERDPAAERQDLRVGRQVDLREESALLRRHDHEAGRGRRHSQCARARAARRLGDDRSHLAGRRHLEVEPGCEIPDVARRAAGGLQFVRRASRQSRSDDARHVRQHPPAQSACAGHRRRRHRPRAERRADEHLRRRDALQAGRHAAGRASRARNTAPARRATGRRKARCCSA